MQTLFFVKSMWAITTIPSIYSITICIPQKCKQLVYALSDIMLYPQTFTHLVTWLNNQNVKISELSLSFQFISACLKVWHINLNYRENNLIKRQLKCHSIDRSNNCKTSHNIMLVTWLRQSIEVKRNTVHVHTSIFVLITF